MSASALTADSDYSVISFFYASAIDITVGVLCVLAFVYYRSKPEYDWVLATRLVRSDPDPWNRDLPPSLPRNIFKIILHFYRIPSEDDIRTIGLDGVILLRFFRMALKFFFFASIIGLCMILQINIAAEDDTDTNFNQLTMEHVLSGDSVFWFHFLSIYLFTVYLLFLLYREFEYWAYLRHNFHLTSGAQGNTTSILISNIPENLKNEEDFANFFKTLYPKDYKSSCIVKETSVLDDLVEKRESLVWKLERFIYTHKEAVWSSESNDEHSKIWKKIESIKNEIEALNSEIESKQKEKMPCAEFGFVTFHTYSSTVLSLLTVKKIIPYCMSASPAVEPVDIYWPNLRLSKLSLWIRWALVWMFMIILILFYMVPISFFASLTTLQNLYELWPSLETYLSEYPSVAALLEGWLPAVGLAIFNLILPEILRFIIVQEGRPYESEIDQSVFSKYYLFQVISFFVITLSSTALVNILIDVVSSPIYLLSLMTSTLPHFSAYFINYIMLYCFIVWPWRFFRFWPIFRGWCLKTFWAKTPKEKFWVEHPGWLRYGREFPNFIIIFMLGLTYATLSPIILPFCFLYFWIGLFVTRHQLMYVFTPIYQSGGAFFPQVFSRLIIGALIYQGFMIAYFVYKSATWQAIMLIPLAVSTIMYHYFVKKGFVNISKVPTQEEVMKFDESVTQILNSTVDEGTSNNLESKSQFTAQATESEYLNPSLKAPRIDVNLIIRSQDEQSLSLTYDI